MIVNAGHLEGQNELEQVLGATMAAVFPVVLRDPSEDANTLLLGTSADATPGLLRQSAETLPAQLQALALAAADRLGPRLPGGSVYTDDRAPVEWLIDRSILEYAASGESVAAPCPPFSTDVARKRKARRGGPSGSTVLKSPGQRPMGRRTDLPSPRTRSRRP